MITRERLCERFLKTQDFEKFCEFMPPFYGAAGASGAGYSIDYAALFDGSTSGVTLTPGVASSQNEAIIIVPYMRAGLGTAQKLYEVTNGGGTDEISFQADNKLYVQIRDAGVASYYCISTAVFRDTGPGCFIFSIDTNAATAADRFRVWHWDTEITAWDTDQRGSIGSGATIATGSTGAHYFGRGAGGSYFDGSIARPIILLDVSIQQGDYAISDFIGTDATTGNPKLKSAGGISFGTKDTFLEFANSGAMGTNTGGTSNWTPTALTQITSTPTNVYAALNPLHADSTGAHTISNGNLTLATGTTDNGLVCGTLQLPSSGTWYWECKYTSFNFAMCGIKEISDAVDGTYCGSTATSYGVVASSGNKFTGGGGSTHGGALTTGDIVMHLWDGDSGAWYWGKGGTGWADGSGGYTDSTPTTPAFTGLTGKYIPIFSDQNPGTSDTIDVNFGVPGFTVASANTDANGLGEFEYAPPTGALALCTNNIDTSVKKESGTFTGNANVTGPYICMGGTPDDGTVTLNGNAATRGTHYIATTTGLKIITSSATYNPASAGVNWTATVSTLTVEGGVEQVAQAN